MRIWKFSASEMPDPSSRMASTSARRVPRGEKISFVRSSCRSGRTDMHCPRARSRTPGSPRRATRYGIVSKGLMF
eukprot:553613-Pyramimonas_sp.AAC.1